MHHNILHLQLKLTNIFLFTLFIACSQEGPLEKKINTLQDQYSQVIKKETDESTQKELSTLLQSLVKMLDEKSYVDPNDQKEMSNIIYKSSILGSALALHLRSNPMARGFYMNAHLLRPTSSLNDLQSKAPKNTDWKPFKNIYIPKYSTQKTTKSNKKTLIHKKDNSKTKPTQTLIIVQEVNVLNKHSGTLLQMLCGNRLQKLKKEFDNLYKMKININLHKNKFASCSWNFEKDNIFLKYMDK